MKNNIFDYAPGELSQDAFLCWCVNWFNDNSNPTLREMAINLIKRLSGQENVESVDIYRQYSSDINIDGEKAALRIDVLFVVNKETAVIIEDKTDTTLHDNQMERYKKGLMREISEGNTLSALKNVKKVITVYFKTGFFYDEDKVVMADVIIKGNDFFDILSPYEGNSEILDSYIENLKGHLRLEENIGNYEGRGDDIRKWNIVCCTIAQYRLMRDVFPEKLWVDKSSWIYRVYDGSSFGRPWTQMEIYENNYSEFPGGYSVFWRIDSDNHGPYISLRLYENFDKNDGMQKERHRKTYERMSVIIRGIVNDSCLFAWDDLYPGYRGNYKESSLIHIKLVQYLRNWNCWKDIFIKEIRRISDEFNQRLAEESAFS